MIGRKGSSTKHKNRPIPTHRKICTRESPFSASAISLSTRGCHICEYNDAVSNIRGMFYLFFHTSQKAIEIGNLA